MALPSLVTQEAGAAATGVGPASAVGQPNKTDAVPQPPPLISLAEFRALTRHSLLPAGVDMPVARMLIAEYLAEQQGAATTPRKHIGRRCL